MKLTKALMAAAAAVTLAGPAAALNIDFEGYLAPGQNVDTLGTSALIHPIVTATSAGPDLRVVRVGSPTDAFVPNDEVTPAGAFGTAFLSTDLWSPVIDVTLSFSKIVKDLSFYIADIDGRGPASNNEEFTATAYKGGAAVGSIYVDAPMVGGDGVAWLFDMSGFGYVDEVVISGVTDGGQRLIGWGLDNIQATPIPVPAAGLMMLAGLGGLAAARRRKTA